MCGRFSLIADLQELGERFGFDPGGLTHPPRYNAAPTQPVLAVMNGEERRAEHLRWGLIPSWAKDAQMGSRMNQCPCGDVGGASGLPSRVRAEALPGPGRRLLRMAAVWEFQNPDAGS